MKLKTSPLKHQIQGIQFMLAHNYCLNCDDMGLGKSLQSLAVANSLATPTLIVAPSYLRINWSQEIEKHLEGATYKVIAKSKDKVNLAEKLNFYIASYTQLEDLGYLFDHCRAVIADEAHYLKNMDSKRTNFFHKHILRSKPDRLMLLTGTPVKNRVPDFYSLLALCGYSPIKSNGKNIKDHYPSSFMFNERFSTLKTIQGTVRGRKFTSERYEGIKNEEELKSYFQFKYLRRLSKDVLDMPPVIRQEIKVSISAEDETSVEWDKYTGKVDDYSARVKAKTALLKSKFTIEMAISIHQQGEQVVIFSDHVKSAEAIHKGLTNAGLITGSVAMDDRQRLVDSFQKGELDYLVLTIGAGSTGINLTRGRIVIFNDLSWTSTDNAQALKRLDRIGQLRNVLAYYIVGDHINKSIKRVANMKDIIADKLL